LIAIVFACNNIEPFIFGQKSSNNVETDNQPLVSIVAKPLNKALQQSLITTAVL